MKIVQEALHQGGMDPAETFCRIPPDSSIEVVNQVAALFRGKGCDSLIALGGGSVIDTAKGVGMVLAQAGSDLLDAAGCEVLPRGAHVPFVAIPTTAGTGSEATLVAVVADPANRVKMEFLSYHLLPDAAVLDPRMTETLPPGSPPPPGLTPWSTPSRRPPACSATRSATPLRKRPWPRSSGPCPWAVPNGKDRKAPPRGHGQRQPAGWGRPSPTPWWGWSTPSATPWEACATWPTGEAMTHPACSVNVAAT